MPRPLRLVCATWLVVILPLLAGAATAQQTVYSTDFESPPGREWSTRDRLDAGSGQALGPCNSRHKECPHRVELTLPEAAAGPLTLEFDLVLLGNWESQGSQADRFEVRAGDRQLLQVTDFPCNLTDEAENLPADAPGAVAVFNRHLGACVLKQRVAIPADVEKPLRLTFSGACSGRRSEFWALDNVRVLRP